jgi:3'-5' exonuclease
MDIEMEIVMDIETLPPERNNWLVRKRFGDIGEEEYRRLSLSAEYSRLLTIGLNILINGKLIHHGLFGRDRNTLQFHLNEKRTLTQFWSIISKYKPHRVRFIGFNIFDFDLLIIWQRSIIHGVRPSVEISFARYRSNQIFDVMREFTRWKWQHYISLDEMAGLLGLQSSKMDGIDGSKVYDLFLQGRHQEIADYCMRDVDLTMEIYHRMIFRNCGTQNSI